MGNKFMQFLGAFSKVKADDAQAATVNMIVRWDKEAATKAEIKILKDQRYQCAADVTGARQALKKDQKQTKVEHDKKAKLLASLEILQNQSKDLKGQALKELMDKAQTLSDSVDECNKEIAREEQEDRDAEIVVANFEKRYAAANDIFQKAEESITRSKRANESARAKQEQQEMMEKLDDMKAGLTGVGIAITAMDEETARIEGEMETSAMIRDADSSENASDLADAIMADAEKSESSGDPFAHLK